MDRLIVDVDQYYRVFDGHTFKRDWFDAYLVQAGIPWPRHESGQLDLSDRTFRAMAKVHPRISPLRELRHSLSAMRLSDLTVGRDGRGRAKLWPFASKTGRNQPSNTKFIFGPSVWLRHLIRPAPGHGLAYIDWSQQEIGIAASQSGDTAMLDAYLSGEVYLAFGKRSGLLPGDATKKSHEQEREALKQCVLGIGYGIKERALATRINRPRIYAREMLIAHRKTFPVYHRWATENIERAVLGRLVNKPLTSVFGWPVYLDEGFRD